VFDIFGDDMQFERVVELANATPTSVLCEAWEATPEDVDLLKSRVQHMTLSQAGELAAVNGLKLPDILGF
jgi:transcriptional regulator of met regulon